VYSVQIPDLSNTRILDKMNVPGGSKKSRKASEYEAILPRERAGFWVMSIDTGKYLERDMAESGFTIRRNC
jgi:hypothetical protein